MPRRPRILKPTDDPGYARILERLLADQRETTLPDAATLDASAIVTDADVDAATALWDAAQRRAGTGLAGLLDAREERAT
jgi:hypothetical protein